ncbi:MAG: deoxyguanosinetriphosphate triphosphohydrolase family protein [Ottowia sp.]|uniref:deoxyguanosinetriphosphate triphosphohydrolase family protein n=1 Tax=Ottowia sp. TaxID=1898956 RepID=UPI0039E3C3E9
MHKPGALAAYASDPAHTRGRRHPTTPAPTRNAYQRDRDRIVHSTAFRRLVYKTQVFLNHEGDLFRTRLTHSLEVAQLARSIARALRLNEDLTEAIALAHDLGHTPFGHAGQDALNDCMAAHGGFEHNLQSLRVVDELEHRYPGHDGLNLTFETREGILKHCSAANARRLEAAEPGGVGRRFLPPGRPKAGTAPSGGSEPRDSGAAWGPFHGTQPSLEAQLANLADEIAYNAHDLDDGVRSGLLTLAQMAEVPLFARFLHATQHEHPGLQGRRVLYESIRRMLSAQVYDVIDATGAALQAAAPASADEARCAGPLVRFGDEMRAQSAALKRFLFANLYRHPQVVHTTDQAKQAVRELFAAYCARPNELRPEFAARADRERAVADYIAGMTDRFALREHERLTGRRLLA